MAKHTVCWFLVAFGVELAACTAEPGDPERADADDVTVHGRGPLSGYPWFTGHWVNGEADRNRRFEAWRDMPADSVTQSMPGEATWYQDAGCVDEACVDRELARSPAAFAPTFDGVFADTGWRGHIWGTATATAHRQRLIHLGWMNAIPSSVGNQDGMRPRVWRDIKLGAADKYFFLLGRKFAYLDAQEPEPAAFPMTFDLTYEWTLVSHPSFPGGHYEIDGVTHETYKDFPYGWSRMVRVFREGYRYQRGRACPYNFSWRPQLIFSVHDADGNVVPHERMWPNHVRDWVIPHDVVIHGVTVLPAGPIGAQADLLCLSWHDSSRDDVRGSSATAPGNNWGQILAGYSTHWGLQAAADFARSRGVRLCMPEWAPRRGPGDASTHPGDVIRFSHELFRRNRDVLSYENVFDQGSGDLDAPWVPAQPRAEEPGTVYRALWHR